jgi:hypothetical protein
MAETNRTYVVGKNPKTNRVTLTLKKTGTIPFAVWRDLGRLAGYSYTDSEGNEVFEFLSVTPNDKLQAAEEVLKGALWTKEQERHEALFLK